MGKRSKKKTMLEPMLMGAVKSKLTKVPIKAVVIDGHLRLQAYYKAGLEKTGSIPVVWLQGDLRSAIKTA